MGLSDEDRRRIHEEENAREEARREIKKEQKKPSLPIGYLSFIAIFAVVFVIALVRLATGGDDQESVDTTPVAGTLLEFTTLREWAIGRDGIGAEVLVAEGSTKEAVMEMAAFIRDVVWPKGFLNVVIYDSAEAWRLGKECGRSRDKFQEIESGPVCARWSAMRDQHLVAVIGRNPNADYSEVSWTGPE